MDNKMTAYHVIITARIFSLGIMRLRIAQEEMKLPNNSK